MKGTPNNLGSMADGLYELRTKRLELESQAKELKSQETILKQRIIEECTNQSLTGARGSLAMASLNPNTVPTVISWEKVEKYILESKNPMFHLMQRRIAGKAYLEHIGLIGPVPGIDPTVLTSLNITRVTK